MWQCVDGRTEVRSENKGSDRGLKNPQTGAHKRLLLPSKPGSNLKAWNVSSGGEIQNKQKRNCAPWQVTFLLCKTLKNISYNWEKHRRNLCWLQSNVIQTVCDTSIGTVMSSAENVSKKIGLIPVWGWKCCFPSTAGENSYTCTLLPSTGQKKDGRQMQKQQCCLHLGPLFN